MWGEDYCPTNKEPSMNWWLLNLKIGNMAFNNLVAIML